MSATSNMKTVRNFKYCDKSRKYYVTKRKENENFPKTKHRVMDYFKLTNKEFKISIMKKFNELQENSER